MTEFEINFRPGGNSAAFVREGWGEPEGFGRWMLGRHSRLVIPPPPWAGGAFQLRALVGPFLRAGKVTAQPLRLVVGGTEVLSLALDGVRELEVTIPEGLIRAPGDTDLQFIHDGAVIPASLDGEGDLRELSVSIWSLTLFGPPHPREIPRPPRLRPPVFHLRSRGNLANRMIQGMVGVAVQARVPGCVLAGVELDEWGLSSPTDTLAGAVPDWADYAILDEQFVDHPAVVESLHRPETAKVSYRGYGQRLDNFPDLETCRGLFRPVTDNVPVYDARYLVINVRAGDILGGTVPDYVLMPVGFYRALIDRTRLIPVFMGQLEPSFYSDMLRAAFPGALFVMSQGPMRDFETMRRAANLVPSVSTFAWLAAWLSQAQRIHLPVNGLFNPRQFPPVDLLPTDDARYEFHLFPVNHAVPPAEVAGAHAALEGSWRSAAASEIAALRRAARPPAGTAMGVPV